MKSCSDQQNSKESQVRDVLSQYIYQDKWIGTKKLDQAVKLIMMIFEFKQGHDVDEFYKE